MIRYVFRLDEKQRFAKEKGKKYSSFEDLRAYLDAHLASEPDLYVSYQNMLKLGINPTAKYGTALGIYAYPADWASKQGIIDNNNAPVGRNRKYVWLFKPRSNVKNNILYLDKSGEVDTRRTRIPEAKLQAMLADAFTYAEHPAESVHELLRAMTFKDRSGRTYTREQSTTFFLKHGIAGIVDQGSGAIYGNEPTQAVFFRKDSVEVVMVAINDAGRFPFGDVQSGIRSLMDKLYKLTINTPQWKTVYQPFAALYSGDLFHAKTQDEAMAAGLDDPQIAKELIERILHAIKVVEKNGLQFNHKSDVLRFCRELNHGNLLRSPDSAARSDAYDSSLMNMWELHEIKDVLSRAYNHSQERMPEPVRKAFKELVAYIGQHSKDDSDSEAHNFASIVSDYAAFLPHFKALLKKTDPDVQRSDAVKKVLLANSR